jgi:hypothetical protein
MKKFSDEENARVDFLLGQLNTSRRHSLPLSRFFEYDDELFQFALMEHPKAEYFYLS